jgi:hypothetical protein
MAQDSPYSETQDITDIDVMEVITTSLPPPEEHPLIDPNNTDNDKLVVVLKAQETDAAVQDVVRVELAEQVAYLKGLRFKANDSDLAAKAIITEKIVLALKKVSELTTLRSKESRDKSGGVVDFHSEQFQQVLGLLTSKILEAVKETGMQEATAQRFFLKLKGKLLGFEDEAAATYNGSGVSSKKQTAANKARFDKG